MSSIGDIQDQGSSLKTVVGSIESFKDWFASHATTTFLYALPLCITVLTTLLIGREWPLPLRIPILFLLTLFLVGFIWAIYVDQDRKKWISDLEGEVIEAREAAKRVSKAYEKLLEHIATYSEGFLLGLAKDLGFPSNTKYSDRISLYSHDQENGVFVQAARFSFNSNLSGKGRAMYSDTEGCIGKAWEHGEHFDNKFPDYENKPKDYIAEQQTRYNIGHDDTKNLTMKSRLYYATQVRSANGMRPLAVIVVESEDNARWTESEIKSFFSKHEHYIVEFVESLVSQLPQPSEAKEIGL